MKKVSIIGFGRFGQTLYRLIKDDFQVVIFARGIRLKNLSENTTVTKDLAEAYKSEVIFYAVPISQFENVIKSHKKHFRSTHVLIDVLSVKVHPEKVFKKYLKHTKTQALLTHPMFGPDSSKNGFSGLPINFNLFNLISTSPL